MYLLHNQIFLRQIVGTHSRPKKQSMYSKTKSKIEFSIFNAIFQKCLPLPIGKMFLITFCGSNSVELETIFELDDYERFLIKRAMNLLVSLNRYRQRWLTKNFIVRKASVYDRDLISIIPEGNFVKKNHLQVMLYKAEQKAQGDSRGSATPREPRFALHVPSFAFWFFTFHFPIDCVIKWLFLIFLRALVFLIQFHHHLSTRRTLHHKLL